MKHVLIADDHEVTRRGVREILTDAYDGLQVGEAADVPAVLAQLHAHPWDLILLDVVMPGGNIVDLLTKIRSGYPEVRILVLTAVLETEYVIQVLRAGANGLVHKRRAAEDLLEAIDTVTQGRSYLDSESATAVATSLVPSKDQALHERLSARERETFLRIAKGQAIKEIAAELNLSEKTVATYLTRIREKMGLSSYVQIARYALQHKLVD